MQSSPASMLLLTFCMLAPSAEAWTKGGPALRATPTQALVVTASQSKGPLDSCGKVAKYDNAEPKNYEDAMETRFNEETKKREDVTFKAGAVVDFKCKKGFTVDGSKDGATEFKAECTDMGYFKPDGVCIEASKCGAVPEIKGATLTAEKLKGAVAFACNPGYSLDGEKPSGRGASQKTHFKLKCVEFSNTYEKHDGCTPYAFVPSKESTRMYTEVFEALFVVTCKGKLTKNFGAGKGPDVEDACGKVKAPGASGECAALVADITAEFEAKKTAVEEHKEDKDWFEQGKDKPGVGDKSQKFCEDLWKLVEKPNEF